MLLDASVRCWAGGVHRPNWAAQTHALHHLHDMRRVHIWTEGGRPTGMALVQFTSPQEASMARAKDRQLMGSRYVEIFPATRGDLDKYSMASGQQVSAGY